MPFTAAHTVAAVPVANALGARAVMSAIVVGTMTPDLGYFLPIDIARWQSHSLAGLLWFCLPVGFGVFAFFHLCVAPLLHDVSPARVRDRLPRSFALGNWPAVRLTDVALCLLLGAMTHLLWDSFTHRNTFLTNAFPVLGRTLLSTEGYNFSIVRVWQHASTAFGFTLLALWTRRWLLAEAPSHPHPAPSRATRMALAAAVLLPATWLGLDAAVNRWGWSVGLFAQIRQSLTGIVFVGGVTWCWSLLAVGLFWRFRRSAPVGLESPPDPVR